MEIIKIETERGDKPALLQLIDPYNQVWIVRWNVVADKEQYTWQEAWITPRPSAEECAAFVQERLKEEEATVMKNGFEWTSPSTGETFVVSLDEENQRNYQAQFIANVRTNIPLSVTPYFFGVHSEKMYVFPSQEELENWYRECFTFGAQVKAQFIEKRSRIRKEDYEI